MKPDFYIIPHQLVFNDNLTPADHLVYATVYWFERMKDGKCIASNETIATACRLKSRAVRGCLERLEKEKFITRIFKDTKMKNRSEIKTLFAFGQVGTAMPTPRHRHAVDVGTAVPQSSKRDKEKRLSIKEAPSKIQFFDSEEDQKKIYTFLISRGMDDRFVSQELKKFIAYWTEPNKSGTKVRWQAERFFDIKRRLATWFNRAKEYKRPLAERQKGMVL